MAYDGSLKFDTKIDSSGFKKGLDSLKKTGLAVGGAIAGALGAAVKVGSDFEAGMSEVAAISGATGESLEQLTKKAEEMGAKTKFSATESAEAFKYMAMAGWKTEDMLNGIEGIMNLAAASGENLGTVSDIVTDALTAFGLTAADSARFADVLAAASSNANTNVSMMGETFKYVAPVAGAMGYSIEDTATAIGLMANSGIKASQAGTSLRQILLGLQGGCELTGKAFGKYYVEVEKADGSMADLKSVMKDLRTAFSQMTAAEKAANAETIAGKIGMSGLLAIVNAGEEDFNKLTSAIENSDGVTQKMADTMNDNLKGKMVLLGSSLEGLGISIYNGLQEPLKEAVSTGIDGVNMLTSSVNNGELKPAIDTLGESLGRLVSSGFDLLVEILPTVINLINGFVTNIRPISALIAGVCTALTTYKAVCTAVTIAQTLMNASNPVGWIGLAITAVTGLVTACGVLEATSQRGSKQLQEIKHRHAELSAELQKERQAYEEAAEARKKSIADALAEPAHLKALNNELQTLVDTNGKVKEGYESRVSFILNELNSAFGTEYQMVDGCITKNEELCDSINAAIIKMQAQALLNATQAEYEDAVKHQSDYIDAYIAKSKELDEAQKESNSLFVQILQKRKEAQDAKWVWDQTRLSMELEDLEKRYAKQIGVVNTAAARKQKAYQVMNDAATAIANHEQLKAAVVTGSMEDIQKATANYSSDMVSAAELEKKSGEEKVQAVSDGLSKILDRYKVYYAEMLSGSDGYNEAGLEKIKSQLQDQAQAYIDAGGDLQALIPLFQGIGADVIAGLVNGTEMGAGEFSAALAAGGEAGAEAIRAVLGIHSPSTVMAEIGMYTMQGLAVGVTNNTALFTAALDALGNTTATEGGNIGKYLMTGIISGIVSNSAAVSSAAANAVASAVNAAKTAGDIHSPSRIMRDEVGAMLVEGMYVGIKSNIKKIPKAFESLMDNIQLQLDVGAITQADYYRKLEQYRDKYLKKGSDKWWEYTKEILGYEKQHAKDQIDLLKWQLELEELSEDEYYNRLAKMRDEYFAEGSEEWQEYTKDIINYEHKKQEALRDDEFKALDQRHQRHLLSDEEYYNQLAALRDKHFTEGSDKWQEYTDEIADYHYDKLYEQTQNVLSAAESTLSQLAFEAEERLSGMSDGFADTFTDNSAKDFYLNDDTHFIFNLKDVQAEYDWRTKFIDDYIRAFERLAEVGDVPQKIWTDLTDMDPQDAINAINALLSQNTPEQIRDWFNRSQEYDDYRDTALNTVLNITGMQSPKTLQTAADAIGGLLDNDTTTAAVMTAAEADGETFIKTLEEYFGTIPDSYYTVGEDCADEFGDGFSDKLDTVLTDLKSGIINGLNGITSNLSIQMSLPSGGGTTNTYHNSYSVTSGGSAQETVSALRDLETYKELAGV